MLQHSEDTTWHLIATNNQWPNQAMSNMVIPKVLCNLATASLLHRYEQGTKRNHEHHCHLELLASDSGRTGHIAHPLSHWTLGKIGGPTRWVSQVDSLVFKDVGGGRGARSRSRRRARGTPNRPHPTHRPARRAMLPRAWRRLERLRRRPRRRRAQPRINTGAGIARPNRSGIEVMARSGRIFSARDPS